MEDDYIYTECSVVVWNGLDPNYVMVHVCPRAEAVKDYVIPLTPAQAHFLHENRREEWVPLALTPYQANQTRRLQVNDEVAKVLDVVEVSTECLMVLRDRIVRELDSRLRSHAI